MKKASFLIFAFALAFSTAFAQQKPASKTAPAANAPVAATGPAISFDQTVFDFGTRNEGEMVNYTFNFKNTGTEPLILSNVQTTCGCTATEWPKEPIMPGKSAAIKATFNTTGKMGQQNKVITVISNAKEGNTMVTIKGTVASKPAQGPDDHAGHGH